MCSPQLEQDDPTVDDADDEFEALFAQSLKLADRDSGRPATSHSAAIPTQFTGGTSSEPSGPQVCEGASGAAVAFRFLQKNKRNKPEAKRLLVPVDSSIVRSSTAAAVRDPSAWSCMSSMGVSAAVT